MVAEEQLVGEELVELAQGIHKWKSTHRLVHHRIFLLL
jgi:hypothetical protein